MSLWVNRTVLSGTSVNPNGTTSHTCTFTAATSGDLLVAIIAGSVTSTTPTGWTLVQSSVNSTGLYVFSKVASSGESSFTTTHNASNFPIQGVVYEFPSSLSIIGSPGTNFGDQNVDTGPACTGLSGVYTRFAVRSWGMGSTATTAAATWVVPTVEDYDAYTPLTGSTSGVALTIAYDDNCSGTSFSPISQYTISGTSAPEGEGVSFAIGTTATVPTPIFVQGTQLGDSTTATTIASAYTYPVSAGDLLVVAVSYGSTSITASASDSQGNTYATAVGPTPSAAIGFSDYIFYAIAGSTGSNTVTVTFSSTVGFRRLLLHDYDNVNTLDGANSAIASSGTPNSGSVTTNFANELIFGWGVTNNGTVSAGTGFTLRETCLSESTEDMIVSSTGSYSAIYPADGSAWICQVATFYYYSASGAVTAWWRA